ncbi:hypothetical protein BC938DRAFT_472869 [Jimgerdemannia flammicorona]|uniref:Uncharacterized protein n=1 Tax=Jimgerdemannia flammicorona TaxID=994334 RepID=A0A433QZU4_9FUNG|nr:hypothetical protein BC938DRAFT_472869 [Jimgerdemannia flammicorona]
MSTPPFTNVLVVNTTSNLGRPVVDELLSHGGYNVHALARPEHKNVSMRAMHTSGNRMGVLVVDGGL